MEEEAEVVESCITYNIVLVYSHFTFYKKKK